MKRENRHVGLGYAFVTFSHADEATQALLRTDGEFMIDQHFVDLLPKGKLDHSEFDQSYFLRKMHNESKMVELATELRESKT